MYNNNLLHLPQNGKRKLQDTVREGVHLTLSTNTTSHLIAVHSTHSTQLISYSASPTLNSSVIPLSNSSSSRGRCTLPEEPLLPTRETQIEALVPASRSLAVVKAKEYSAGRGGQDNNRGPCTYECIQIWGQEKLDTKYTQDEPDGHYAHTYNAIHAFSSPWALS